MLRHLWSLLKLVPIVQGIGRSPLHFREDPKKIIRIILPYPITELSPTELLLSMHIH